MRYVARRWRGEVPTPVAFWRDMLGVGTLVNLLASFVALVIASRSGASWLAVALHFAPVPLNLLLFRAVVMSRPGGSGIRLAAAVWLVLMFVV